MARVFRGQQVKDQITTDLLTAGAKIAPPAAVAVASGVGAISPHTILVWLTIIYTLSLLMTNVVKNWGMWLEWWDKRSEDLRRVWARFRRRG